MIGAGVMALTLISSPYLSAEEPAQENGEKKPLKGAFPTLDILPEGSVLRRVRLPRYDKDFIPISLLTAEQMTVLDQNRIKGLDVNINLYAKDGSVDARAKMREAIYNQELSTLHVSDAVFIEGKSYQANGTGMVFDWKSNRGFLLGPINTKFTKTPPPTSTTMQFKPSPAPRAIAGSLIFLTSLSTSTMAEPPAKLTATQIEDFDRLTEPFKHQIALEQEETRSTLTEDERLNNKASAVIEPFLEGIGQGNLLVTTSATPKAEEATPPATEEKPAAPKSAKATPVETLKITCDGGLYFDTETGILAYLKNVDLVGSNFTLTCTDELKVFLEKKVKPKKVKASDTPEAKNDEAGKESTEKKATDPKKKKEDKKEDAMAGIGDLERIIATGKVKITRKDEQGRLFIATAESASYNAITGETILRGGKPRLQLGPNQFLQSLAPGQYIRILANGKFITEGKWTMVTPVKKDKLKP